MYHFCYYIRADIQNQTHTRDSFKDPVNSAKAYYLEFEACLDTL